MKKKPGLAHFFKKNLCITTQKFENAYVNLNQMTFTYRKDYCRLDPLLSETRLIHL